MDKIILGNELDRIVETIDKQFLADCVYNFMDSIELEMFINYLQKELQD